MKRILDFLRREVVLCIAILLAVLSMTAVPPDEGYGAYMDYRTLAILFGLMCVMAGLQKLGIFGWTAGKLLGKVSDSRGIVLVLVLLCFFFSMLVTNDVALLTFVPFTFTVLDLLGKEDRKRLVLPVVAMQTIAANLGSMLTPIGNPQNLYLYGKAGIPVGEFLLLMLPYTMVSLVLLLAWGIWQGRPGCRNVTASAGKRQPGRKGMVVSARDMEEDARGRAAAVEDGNPEQTGTVSVAGILSGQQPFLGTRKDRCLFALYLALFLVCLLGVAHILPWQIMLVVVAAAVCGVDRQVLARVDYSLLLTFTGFFIFVGNMGRIPVFCSFLQETVTGRETYVAVLASQVISNVPAALLLSGFTGQYTALVIGTNLGGLGTLIASMASLISYKYVAKEEGKRKGAYLGIFTAGNLCFLVVLLGLYAMIG